MKKIIWSITAVIVVLLIAAMIYNQQKVQKAAFMPKQKNVPKNVVSFPVVRDKITYTIQEEKLYVTFNRGKSWEKVPVAFTGLFSGDESVASGELRADTYLLENDRTGFIYVENTEKNKPLRFVYTENHAKTWKVTTISKKTAGVTFRNIHFLNSAFGYSIYGDGRVMSQEGATFVTTSDNGKSWKVQSVGNLSDGNIITGIIYAGGFIDERTGFISFTKPNPERPQLILTQDKGKTWRNAIFQIPEKYRKIFVVAETPEKAGSHLQVLLNQGQNGDYKGGKVKGKFVSNDNGAHWQYQKEQQVEESTNE